MKKNDEQLSPDAYAHHFASDPFITQNRTNLPWDVYMIEQQGYWRGRQAVINEFIQDMKELSETGQCKQDVLYDHAQPAFFKLFKRKYGI